MNDITSLLTKADESSAHEMDQQYDKCKIGYRDKLAETGLFPLTHRMDRNVIQLACEAISNRIKFPSIEIKVPTNERLGPFASLSIAKEKRRPPSFERLIKNSLSNTAIRMFNMLKQDIRKKFMDKGAFKKRLSDHIKNLDVLDLNGIPLERMKLQVQLPYHRSNSWRRKIRSNRHDGRNSI